MSTDIVVFDDRKERRMIAELLTALEQAGAVDEVSLTLTDRNMPYERWEGLGRFFGSLDRRLRWYLGDWLNFGEAVYGEDSAQAVEATTKERYNEAERVTGLDRQTLMNIRSVCARVAKPRRRKELGFWIHQEVASLEPDDQVVWLQRAIDEGWSMVALREAIREAFAEDAPDDDEGGEGGGGPSLSERIEAAARLVYDQASHNSDGDFVVPSSAMAQLAAALGEE